METKNKDFTLPLRQTDVSGSYKQILFNDHFQNFKAYNLHTEWVNKTIQRKKDIEIYGYSKTEMDKDCVNLFSEWSR